MSANEVWAKLGGDPAGIGKAAKAEERATLHGVGAAKANETNDPMGTPFLDTESQFAKTVPQALSSPLGASMFAMGDVVLHLRSGALYGVLDTPDGNLVLERTGERAYMYKRLDGEDPRKWVRSQAEMEDGRFALHRCAPTARRFADWPR